MRESGSNISCVWLLQIFRSFFSSRARFSPRLAGVSQIKAPLTVLGGVVRGGRFETQPKRILNEFPKIADAASGFEFSQIPSVFFGENAFPHMPERAAGVPRALGRAPGCELCAGLAISGIPSVFSLSASRNGASPRVARFPDFLQCFLWLGLETWGGGPWRSI